MSAQHALCQIELDFFYFFYNKSTNHRHSGLDNGTKTEVMLLINSFYFQNSMIYIEFTISMSLKNVFFFF